MYYGFHQMLETNVVDHLDPRLDYLTHGQYFLVSQCFFETRQI